MLDLENINYTERRDNLLARRKVSYDMSNVRFRRLKTIKWNMYSAASKGQLLK